jgi:hypothetical protein
MKLSRTIGHPGSPPSKGGISGAGGYYLNRPSFKEYYSKKKRPIKEHEDEHEDEEEKEMSPLKKTALALGISIPAVLALSPTARAGALKLIGVSDTTTDTGTSTPES